MHANNLSKPARQSLFRLVAMANLSKKSLSLKTFHVYFSKF